MIVDSDKEKKIMDEIVLPLPGCIVWGYKNDDEMATIHFKRCKPSLDAVGDAFRCLCLRCAGPEHVKYESDLNRLERETSHTAAEKQLGVTAFEIVPSTVYVARASTAVYPSTVDVPWNRHQSNVNRFFQESWMRWKRVHD